MKSTPDDFVREVFARTDEGRPIRLTVASDAVWALDTTNMPPEEDDERWCEWHASAWKRETDDPLLVLVALAQLHGIDAERG